jgi:hypothetical protein
MLTVHNSTVVWKLCIFRITDSLIDYAGHTGLISFSVIYDIRILIGVGHYFKVVKTVKFFLREN